MNNLSKNLKESILRHLHLTLARDENSASNRDWWLATSHAVRDRLLERYMRTQKAHNESNTRRMYYLSLEYLMGRLFNNYLHNANVHGELEEALKELGLDSKDLQDEESEMGLGNGGLGRSSDWSRFGCGCRFCNDCCHICTYPAQGP